MDVSKRDESLRTGCLSAKAQDPINHVNFYLLCSRRLLYKVQKSSVMQSTHLFDISSMLHRCLREIKKSAALILAKLTRAMVINVIINYFLITKGIWLFSWQYDPIAIQWDWNSTWRLTFCLLNNQEIPFIDPPLLRFRWLLCLAIFTRSSCTDRRIMKLFTRWIFP